MSAPRPAPGGRPTGRRGRRPRRGAADRGSATVELAAALPAVLVLLVVLLTAARLVVVQLDCVDAARAGARAAARGEPGDVVRASAAALAPPGARVTVRRTAGLVVVDVASPQSLAGPLGGRVLARASATAALEQPVGTG
ncbi:TadE family type IV pilus minor pilin [Kineococcus sp. SYSU DK004]|uniref:TadE family type IV pilus minor pilin n=1 Tax=Kineococcus sp. SYSU DK004 TaxID=3383125 RepID=UPI003D7EB784